MKKAKLLLAVLIVTLSVIAVVSTAYAGDGITPTLPTQGTMQDIGQGIGKLVTIVYNLIAVILLFFIGYAWMMLVEASIEQNPMKINHERQAIYLGFGGFAAIALTPMIAHVILNVFGFNLIISYRIQSYHFIKAYA